MDPGKLEYYEFLDLSDIDENERQQLKQTLYSTSTPDFLQLPWTNHDFATEEWQKETYEDEAQHVPNGPLDVVCTGGEGAVAPHLPAVTMYSQHPPPYSMPPPSSGYQHPQNVFVSNVSAANMNVHGYMTGHYVHPHYPMSEPPDMGRGHRGRSRGRGKRNDVRMESAIETTTAPGFSQPFVSIHPYHPAAYYTQPVGSPMQHPNAQHATGSPLYIAPMYTHVYNPYHPHGAHQYYPPPSAAHVNAMMEDSVPDVPEMAIEPPPQPDQPVYQQQNSEEDYENVVPTTVIVNSNMDPMNCEVRPTEHANIGYINNGNNVIPEVHDNVENKPVTVPPIVSSVDTVKTEPAGVQIGIVTNNNNIKPFVEEVETFSAETVQAVNSVPQPPQPVEPPAVPSPVPVPVTVNNIQPDQEISVDSFKIEERVHTDVEAQEPAPSTTPGKSWASLFNKSSSPATVPQVTQHSDGAKASAARPSINPFPKLEEKQIENEKSASQPKPANSNMSAFTNDPISHRMGEFISKYALDNRTVSLQPRGLTNRSNYCYINSILQALLACPPFYNLLKALPYQPRKNPNAKSPTPIIDSMVEFVNEFTPLSAESRLNRKEKGQRKDNIDVICGIAFEPARIYKILNGIRTDTFIVEGRQEDAEEFFGCLLNGLNDEMLELTKLVEGQNHQNLSNGDIATNGDSHDQDEVEWTKLAKFLAKPSLLQVMGPKNKGSITRRADFGRTPISDIFRGQLRSRVHRTGDQITDNVQPFFTLQLDIEKTNSVYEALELLVNKDKLEGVTCSRTNQQVEAWQQVTIEELPLVMVLHLKCFNYKMDGCSKIIKALEFPIELKIDSKLLSSKAKYSVKQKQYKLFAVVYHDGKEATKGHYLTDAYHVGYGGWVRYDDATVKSVQETHVMHPTAARVPYLLFYRRSDTIGNQANRRE